MTTGISIFIAIVLAVLISVTSYVILNVHWQTENYNSNYSLDISKEATSGLTITNGVSFVINSFRTTYTIKENKFDYERQKIYNI